KQVMSTTPGQSNSVSIEQTEEAKLKQKYPNLNRKSIGSSVLHKRLNNKGQKYFDSGDYNMAKAKVVGAHRAPTRGSDLLDTATGDTMATPESVPAVRKKSLVGGLDPLLPPQQLLQPQQLQQHRKPSIACTEDDPMAIGRPIVQSDQ
ncbi:hypothetical protein BOX15_Mlig032456g2, partial [Macrostomum lignano]